jgi:hypothetical protein
MSNPESKQERLGEYYNRYERINTDEYNKNQYTSNDFKTVFSNNFNQQLSISQEPDVKYELRENYLIVSSTDRDVNTYSSSSNFVIQLEKEYKNIVSVELIQAIVPDKNNVTAEPYLLLKIKEFENTMDSNNKQVYDSFAILQVCTPTITNSFLQIDKRIFENVTLNYRTPRANLSKLTIQITDAEGNIFDFGGSGTTTKANQCLFVFKIVTSDSNRSLINNRNVY